jgi:hypothetical protein
MLLLLFLSLLILLKGERGLELEDVDNIKDLVPFPNLFIIGTQKVSSSSSSSSLLLCFLLLLSLSSHKSVVQHH